MFINKKFRQKVGSIKEPQMIALSENFQTFKSLHGDSSIVFYLFNFFNFWSINEKCIQNWVWSVNFRKQNYLVIYTAFWCLKKKLTKCLSKKSFEKMIQNMVQRGNQKWLPFLILMGKMIICSRWLKTNKAETSFCTEGISQDMERIMISRTLFLFSKNSTLNTR